MSDDPKEWFYPVKTPTVTLVLNDTQIDIAVSLNTAIMALHEAVKITVRVGWPDYTEPLRAALDILLVQYSEITKEEK